MAGAIFVMEGGRGGDFLIDTVTQVKWGAKNSGAKLFHNTSSALATV